MLERKLKQMAKRAEVYPFHMPGHKRMLQRGFPDPFSIDITEIEDFDNLHHPQGVILEEQERAAGIYSSKQCYFLVNGSTCGILAAISAAVPRGSRILIARNSHRSVYNACFLRQLQTEYVYPVNTRSGLQGQISPRSVEKQLKAFKNIKAVVITSPTYDGIVSNVEAIAEVVHRWGIPLIVDEAHGAHFGLHDAFPENATRLGADAVIMSVHKTLPAFTQTALLHLCSDRIDPNAVSRFLAVYETSSPSYLLMAGLSHCMHMLETRTTRERIDNYVRLLDNFRSLVKGLSHLKVLGTKDFLRREIYDLDIGKIIISAGDCGLNGAELKSALLVRYLIQTEMASGGYVLAMTSFMDTSRGFDRLGNALLALDEHCTPDEWMEEPLAPVDIYRDQEKCMELYEAGDAAHEEVLLAEAAGRICADYVYLYPPGVPILVPGERITEWTLLDMEECKKTGLTVEGLLPSGGIEVVKIR